MAQDYNINIKRYNGQDYDRLLPTPAPHHSSHESGGNDVIAVTNDMIVDKTIKSTKIEDKTIGRDKIADNVLYSPIKQITATSYDIVADDAGKTLVTSTGNVDFVINMPAEASKNMPLGAEIAIIYRKGTSCKINFGNEYSACTGMSVFNKSNNYDIPERYGMVAIKKIEHGVSSSYWIVTGNVEVVET